MNINELGFVGLAIILIIILLMTLSIVIYIYKYKNYDKVEFKITPEENKKFIDDSIAIQPSNTPIFPDENTHDIIESGFELFRNEQFKLLKGVDTNAI